MKSIYFSLLLGATVASANAYAASSTLSVMCKGSDVGAEIFVNDKFKGECPLDIKVPTGTLKLKVQKKNSGGSDRIFEQEIQVNYNVVKTVDVLLVDKAAPEGKQSKSAPKKVAGTACTACPVMVPIPGTDFELGKYTVTFDEWDACVADGGCNGYTPPDEWGRLRQPVTNVSWNDVQSYLEWLSQKTGKTYRLPSERELELATRAGTSTQYYWGDELGSKNANCNGCESRYGKRTHLPAVVGTFKPNPYGLYDMVGNVWQWTDGCREGDCAKLILRGGSFEYGSESFNVSYREGIEATERINNLGFRVARTIPKAN